MDSLRFIHAADLHLGSSFPLAAGAAPLLKEHFAASIQTAVENLVKDAISLDVDFIILAGDLFDGENRGLKNQLFLKRKLELLSTYNIPVYVIFGNHDPVEYDYAPAGWPDHVHIFGTVPETKVFWKSGKPAAHLYGCSYETRAVRANLAQDYKKVSGAPFHIGILHGQEQRNTDHHDAYAPFLIKDLKEKEMDYWALGHIHRGQALAQNIYYPGNIQGRHRKETGKKGYLLVSMTKEKQVHTVFRQAAPITLEKMEVSITEIDSFDKLTDKLLEQIETYSNSRSLGLAVELILSGEGVLSSHLSDETEREEWREALNEIGAAEQPFFYIHTVQNHTSEENEQKEQHLFLEDVDRAADYFSQNPEGLVKELTPLVRHPLAKKLIAKDTVEEQELIKEARLLIRHLWAKGGKR
ncbi:metallophosphoesterase family protein [Bacillus piscicola]|uniref:metallophosphoesterase family protein n=1 Tax=Bacillus piscicola TaxID=1632684 RepID=UPI001F095BD2